MATITVHCPHCQPDRVYRHGKTAAGHANYRCPACPRLPAHLLTQRIERNNLTLRARLKRLARKTICFSCCVELHEKVIGVFIEKYHFN